MALSRSTYQTTFLRKWPLTWSPLGSSTSTTWTFWPTSCPTTTASSATSNSWRSSASSKSSPNWRQNYANRSRVTRRKNRLMMVCLLYCTCLLVNFMMVWFVFMSLDQGQYCFCPVCLSIVNFKRCYNFWTVRDRDFIFGILTQLMMPFKWHKRWFTIWPWHWTLCL